MRFRFIIVFLLCSGIAHPQARKLDSLFNVLKTANEDSFKVQTLDHIFLIYLNSDIKKAREFALTETELSKKLNFRRGISFGLMNMGILAQQEGDYPVALDYFLRALKMNEDMNYNLTNTYINIANTYTDLKDYNKALEYHFKALKRVRTHTDSTLADVAASIPVLYNNISSAYFRLGNYPASLDYGRAGFNAGARLNDKISMAVACNNIGVTYFKLGKQEIAEEFYLRALQYGEELNSLLDIGDATFNLGELYLDRKDYRKALGYFQRALKTTFLSGYRVQRLAIYQDMIKCYQGLQDYKNKNDLLEKYITLKDSIFDEEKSAQIARMRTKFETEEKEKANLILAGKNQIQELELHRKNYLMYGLSLAIIATALIAWALLRQNRVRAQQRATQLEQKLLRSQMNPHFIFNSLTTIESFIYENEPRQAGRYLSDFARLMRLILENSSEEYIPLEKEIQTLEYYLNLQKLRLENRLEYTIHVDESLQNGDVLIPPMLTQPFIENAIEHGFRGRSENGRIDVAFRVQDEQILVEVQDNGIGISKAMQNEKTGTGHRSMAMQITRERLSVLNRSKKQKMSFFVSDLGSGGETGTKVRFSIPLV